MNRFVGIFSKFRHGRFMKIMIAHIIEERAGVAMGSANHDVGNGNAGFLAGLRAGIGCDVERDADEIAKNHRDFLIALAENERFGFERIVNAGRKAFIEIACDAHAGGRRDIDFGSAGLNRVTWSCSKAQ